MKAAAIARGAGPWIVGLLVAAMAAIIRLRSLGDLVAHGDEQFYLLVGDRVLNHGAVPYVDLWDRKPVGLFLLYAAIRLLGGDGVVQYQLVATAFAAATAGIIGVWLYRAAGVVAAICAALLYLAILQAHLGFGGQAEVLLNLFVVAAGAIVFRRLQSGDRPVASRPGTLAWTGAAAMLLVGVAIQIKPTALFPGFWLGLVLLFLAYREKWSLGRIAAVGSGWVLAALAPTLAIIAWYAAIGQLDSYLYANLSSIISKGSDGAAAEAARRMQTVSRLGLPFGAGVALLAYGMWRQGFPREQVRTFLFLIGWLASGVAAFFALKAAYPHYAMVAAPMGSLVVGYGIGRGAGLRWATAIPRWLMVLLTLAVSGRMLIADQARIAQNRAVSAQLKVMSTQIRAQLHGGCLYVFRGPPILYRLTDSCLVTRYAFPNHLSTQAEASGLGADPTSEVARILRGQPRVIVDGPTSFHLPNLQTQAMVRREIAAHYQKIGEVRTGAGDPIVAYSLKAAP